MSYTFEITCDSHIDDLKTFLEECNLPVKKTDERTLEYQHKSIDGWDKENDHISLSEDLYLISDILKELDYDGLIDGYSVKCRLDGDIIYLTESHIQRDTRPRVYTASSVYHIGYFTKEKYNA